MNFPWRDYAWAVLIIGLLIGLAVEQRRLRVFSAARDQAEQYERNAYELGRKICDPAGGQMLISHDTIFLPTARHGQWVTEIVNVPHVFETKEKDESYLTGMADLDRMF